MVKACWICGSLVLRNCWHPDTGDVPSRDMSIEDVLELRKMALRYAEDELSLIQRDMNTLSSMKREGAAE